MAESRISMEEEKLFRIGDVAKMFHISTGTLRHYERIGIVVPEFIEEKSSYRYYGIRQFEVLNTIRYLRVLDMPLEQIADFLANRDIQVIEEKLQNQKEMIREKKRQLEVIERKIDHRIHQIQDAASSKLDEIRMQLFKQFHRNICLHMDQVVLLFLREKLSALPDRLDPGQPEDPFASGSGICDPLSGKRPAGFSDLPWKSGCWHIRRKAGKRSTGCL